jgi:hypothetical protein
VLGRIIRQPKNAVPSESPGEEKGARGKHRRIQTSARVRPNPPKKLNMYSKESLAVIDYINK